MEQKIIDEVAAKHGLTAVQLTTKCTARPLPTLVAAKRELVVELAQAGHCVSDISRLVGAKRDTVSGWLRQALLESDDPELLEPNDDDESISLADQQYATALARTGATRMLPVVGVRMPCQLESECLSQLLRAAGDHELPGASCRAGCTSFVQATIELPRQDADDVYEAVDRFADCHPTRPHEAGGLCKACYIAQQRRCA